MTEYFRRKVICLFLKDEMINEDFAGNLLSWKNSGFSIDNSVQILTDKARINLSEYISRAPVSLGKLRYEPFKGRVLFHTQYNKYFGENVHMSDGCDFLAGLTQYIPPRGTQYIRRYGLYASRTKGKWSEYPEIVRHAPHGLVASFKTIYLFLDSSGPKGTKIIFSGVRNSWIRNIETSGYLYHAISLINCSFCEVRDSYVHNSLENAEHGDQNGAYGIEIAGRESLAAYNLVENNILDWFRHSIILQVHCMNNVVAYNLCWTSWGCQVTGCGYSRTTDIELHHPDYDDLARAIYFTLIEGNVVESPAAQNNNHNNNAWFRNRINQRGLSIMTNNIAVNNEFTERKRPDIGSTNIISSIHGDSVMHGNYFTESPGPGIFWDDSITDRTFPASYYFDSRPDWFGDLDWPCCGGDLMPGNLRRNPAEVRYWTMLFPEETPSNLQAAVSGNDVTLTWDNNSANDVDFIICRSVDNSEFYRIGETTGTSYTDTVPASGKYYF